MRRDRGRIALAVLVLVVLWLVVGFVRAPGVARGYIVGDESPRKVSNLTTSTAPGVPPFFIVWVETTITEPGGASYTSARILAVEPLSGIVISLAAG